jgi:GAF domain-containing protein
MPSIPIPTDEELVPEKLVPRLGDYLLERGLITSRELHQALEYQKKKASSGQPKLIGRALMELGYIDRETLDKVVIAQIFSLHSALQEANQSLEQRVHQRTLDLEKRLAQINTTAEIAQVAISAKSLDQMLSSIVGLIVQRMRFDHAAVFLIDETGKFAVMRAATGPLGQVQNLEDYRLPVGSPSVIGWVSANNQVCLITESNQQNLFFKGDLLPNVRAEVGIPINLGDSLLGLLHVQNSRGNSFDNDAITTLQTISNFTASLIQNHRLLETTQQNLKVMEKRLVVLETLDLVNKTISAETNLNSLYKLIHEQIIKVMGEVDFLIALSNNDTNSIVIPYAFESGRSMSMPSYPRGQGLTSILIKEKRSFMLVEDVERRAIELGVKVFGKPAKSWMGAPLLVGGEAIGAIVVQDFEREHRFDDDDQRLLNNLATQVAITVRNAFQLEAARLQADKERMASEMSAKLWASTDLHTILRTAIQELSQKLEASEGIIYLQAATNQETSPGNNGNRGEQEGLS